MSKNMNNVESIRDYILKQTKPFCIADLYHRAKKAGITDRGLILKVLDELDKEGFIGYGKIPNQKEPLWGFYIAS